jgi:UrcA family protein
MNRIITTVSALAITAALVVPAHAASPDPIVVVTQVVKTADLDLGTAAGAHKALGRIERAARELCAAGQTPFTASQASKQRVCTEQAMVAAVQGSHSQMLSIALAARMSQTQLAGR